MEDEVKVEVRPEAEGDSEGNITVKRNKTLDFVAKIICVLIAFFIWYYAASLDTVIYEEEFQSVTVTVKNSSNMALLSGDGMTVDVIVSGKRNDLRNVKASEIKAYVEIPENITAGRHELAISYDIPFGVKFEKSSASTIVVYVDHSVKRAVPVRVNLVKFNHEAGSELKISSVADIIVEGPAQIVNSIEYAELPVDMGNQTISKSMTYRSEVILRNTDGEAVSSDYLTMSSMNATVTISVYKERTVPIIVKFKNGFYSGNDYILTLSRESIKVKGDAEKVQNMVIECVIDEKTLQSGVKVSAGIGLPSDVQNLDEVYNIEVTVKLKDMIEKEFTVIPEAINGTMEGSLEPITVKLRGKTAVMEAITEADIKAYVDLQGVGGSTITLPINFEFSSFFTSKVHEVYPSNDPYEVTVTVLSSEGAETKGK